MIVAIIAAVFALAIYASRQKQRIPADACVCGHDKLNHYGADGRMCGMNCGCKRFERIA